MSSKRLVMSLRRCWETSSSFVLLYSVITVPLTRPAQVWRLFVVYNRNWYVVVLPVLVLLVNAGKLNYIQIYLPLQLLNQYPAAGYYTTWTFVVAHPGSSIFEYSHTFVTIFFVFTMVVNAACTGMFSLSVWTNTAMLIALP